MGSTPTRPIFKFYQTVVHGLINLQFALIRKGYIMSTIFADTDTKIFRVYNFMRTGHRITQTQARAGYANIAQGLPEEQKLAAIYGEDAGKVCGQLVSSEFNTAGSAQAKTQLANLGRSEISAFSGSAGASKGTLGVEQTGIL